MRYQQMTSHSMPVGGQLYIAVNQQKSSSCPDECCHSTFIAGLLLNKEYGTGSRSQVHNEVMNGAVSGVFRIANIFDPVVNSLNYRAFS